MCHAVSPTGQTDRHGVDAQRLQSSTNWGRQWLVTIDPIQSAQNRTDKEHVAPGENYLTRKRAQWAQHTCREAVNQDREKMFWHRDTQANDCKAKPESKANPKTQTDRLSSRLVVAV